MAPFTDAEIIPTESAFAVVAGHAALPAAGRMVIQRFGRCDLSSLRLPGAHLMALVAGFLLVLRVTKADAKRRHHFRRARVAT